MTSVLKPTVERKLESTAPSADLGPASPPATSAAGKHIAVFFFFFFWVLALTWNVSPHYLLQT
jgi:hypothetical protein